MNDRPNSLSYADAGVDIDAGARLVERIKPLARSTRRAGADAALVGGETAEMPGLYAGDDYDLAGFCVGAVSRGEVLPRLEAQQAGDVLIGLASSGPHSNGYSLIRRIVEVAGRRWTDPAPFAPSETLGKALLTPTRIYVASVLPLARKGLIKGAAHITGGGLVENPPRAVAPGLTPSLDWASWALPPVFAWLQGAGGLTDRELRRTFNCGLGFLLIAAPEDAEAILDHLAQAGETAFVCGALTSED